jgi:peptidyl-prolyl cis-trans isomerase A (cyclophilin A)
MRRSALPLFVLTMVACAPRSMSSSDSGTPFDGGPGVDSGHATDAGPPGDAGSMPDTFQVEFTTSRGTFVLEAHRSWAPHGVDRLYELVTAGFYDQCRFFRVITGFVAQFGMNGTPATEHMWSGRTITDDPVMQSNIRGYVSYAATGAPNSRTTQLFVNYGNNAGLDSMGFAPIGQVISGMDVVDMFYAGYGESPSQSSIESSGNTYLMSSFPMLDYIVTARIL